MRRVFKNYLITEKIMTREEFVNAKWEYGMEVKVTNDLINGEVLEVAGVDFINGEVSVYATDSVFAACPFCDVEILPDTLMFD